MWELFFFDGPFGHTLFRSGRCAFFVVCVGSLLLFPFVCSLSLFLFHPFREFHLTFSSSVRELCLTPSSSLRLCFSLKSTVFSPSFGRQWRAIPVDHRYSARYFTLAVFCLRAFRLDRVVCGWSVCFFLFLLVVRGLPLAVIHLSTVETSLS